MNFTQAPNNFIARRPWAAALATTAALLGGVACGSEDNDPLDPGPDTTPVTTYSFTSRFEPGVSSVNYSGQVKRHLLITSLGDYLLGLSDTTFSDPQPGDVVDALDVFYNFKDVADPSSSIRVDVGTLSTLQQQWSDLGILVSLQEKMPEVDAGLTENVMGWAEGAMTPEQVLFDLFGEVESLIIARTNGQIPADPNGTDISVPYVGQNGIDYHQLILKFLGGAVALSQGSDDYLDDDIDGRGLLSDNAMPADSDGVAQPYTALEHSWDEGFGYFGAARDYGDYTDDEIAAAGGRPEFAGGYHDTNGDGQIDVLSEMNVGHSVNAAKRDRGTADGSPTDFTQDAWDAFVAGRQLIVEANGALSADQLATLRGYRDAAVHAWESAIAATAVHYVNDTIDDMNAFGSDEYNFFDNAKHWSELKGFALALQFNVNHSALTTAQLQEIHDLLGEAPVLPNASTSSVSDYQDDLLEVRRILGEAFSFSQANLEAW